MGTYRLVVRVIAGSSRGRVLRAPAGAATRPTSDKVREAIFDILDNLVDLEGAKVADLFAGSGALGIEALSRGAASVVFVDRSSVALKAVRYNLAAVGLEDADASLVRDDVLSWLARRSGTGAEGSDRLDLALCDPPYDFAAWAELLARLEAGLAVLESDRPVLVPETWKVIRNKRYGGTLVTVVRAAGTQSSGDRDRGDGAAGHCAGTHTTVQTNHRSDEPER